MSSTPGFSIRIQKRDDIYWIDKPEKSSTYVKAMGKTMPFLSVPHKMGWDRKLNEAGNIEGWTTSSPDALSSMAALDFVLCDEGIMKEIASARVTQEMSRFTDDVVLQVPPNDAGFVLRPYQKAGVAFILRAWEKGYGSINTDEVGLGKTAQSLVAASFKSEEGRILIVCPANVRYNWRKEIMTWWNYEGSPVVVPSIFSKSGYRVDYNAIDVIDKRRPPREDAKVVICSYSMFSAGELTAQMITRHEYAVAIIDESHYLKNRTSSRSKLATMINAKYRIALTATPVERVGDMYPIVSWLDPGTWDNYGTYAQAFPRGKRGVTKLNESLRSTILVGRKKADVAKDLPPLIWDTRVVDADIERHPVLDAHAEAIQMELNELKEQWAVLLEENPNKAPSIIRRQYNALMSKMGKISGISPQEIQEMRVEAAWAKLDFVIEQAEIIIKSGDQLVIGHHHREVGKEIFRRIDGIIPDQVAEINGSVKPAEREAIREKFDAGEVRVIVASITAAATGINLQAANNIIMAELDWSGANNYQFAGRIHRIGQNKTCYVMVPVISGSIEQHVMTVQSRKQEILSIVQEV